MEKKKQRHIAFVVLALLIIMAMLGIGDDSDVETGTEDVGTEVNKVSDSNKKEDAEPKEIEDVFPQTSENEDKIHGILDTSMKKTGYVMFEAESKTYYLYPTNEGFNSEIVEMIAGQKSHDDWYGFVSSMIDASYAIQDVLGDGYTYAVINPSNEDKVILAVMDGVVIYNLFNE